MILSVVICTRDRPAELQRCVESVLQAIRVDDTDECELLVVDDGQMESRIVESLLSRAAAARISFAHVKAGSAGVFEARRTGTKHARGDVVLFLDDDVTIAPDYLRELSAAYRRHPAAAGIGGVDQLDPGRPFLLRVLHRLFLFDSGSPGRLSLSGFNGSARRWISQQTDFESDYLFGCDMSYRRSAVADLPIVDWLTGYSLGEDLYISWMARRHGVLVVSPALRVEHHRSPTARDEMAAVGRAQVVNMFRLLRVRHQSPLSVAALFWTLGWFIMKDTCQPRRARLVPGYLRGILELLTT